MAPTTIAMYRLAITEAAHSGELGAALYAEQLTLFTPSQAYSLRQQRINELILRMCKTLWAPVCIRCWAMCLYARCWAQKRRNCEKESNLPSLSLSSLTTPILCVINFANGTAASRSLRSLLEGTYLPATGGRPIDRPLCDAAADGPQPNSGHPDQSRAFPGPGRSRPVASARSCR